MSDLLADSAERLMRSRADYRMLYAGLRDYALPVSPDTGRLLYMLARAVRAHSIVEFGTSFGLSTLHLAAALRDGAPGYRRELAAYVAPWSDVLAQVTQPVTLWHGTDDTWAPIAMAEALAAALPQVAAVHRLAGLSHYSALAHALALIDRCDPV